jgi:hypothetical protein
VESCILQFRQILARLFAQIHIEFAVVLEGLHKIFARKLDLYRLTEWQMRSRLEDHDKYPPLQLIGTWCTTVHKNKTKQNKTQANMKRETAAPSPESKHSNQRTNESLGFGSGRWMLTCSMSSKGTAQSTAPIQRNAVSWGNGVSSHPHAQEPSSS